MRMNSWPLSTCPPKSGDFAYRLRHPDSRGIRMIPIRVSHRFREARRFLFHSICGPLRICGKKFRVHGDSTAGRLSRRRVRMSEGSRCAPTLRSIAKRLWRSGITKPKGLEAIREPWCFRGLFERQRRSVIQRRVGTTLVGVRRTLGPRAPHHPPHGPQRQGGRPSPVMGRSVVSASDATPLALCCENGIAGLVHFRPG